MTTSDPDINKHVIQPITGEIITSLMTGNSYTIGAKIGEGYFGIVYSCKDVWENELAVKVLKPTGSYEKIKDSANNEFIKLIQLRYPFITYVFDAFEYRDTFYIITELCHSPLTEIFQHKDFNGLNWIIPIARGLLQAVHFLHINSYAHQDIHPGNIFATFIKDELNPNNPTVLQFKLGDLGVSRLLNEMDAQNTMAQWMLPPEVLNDSDFGVIDHRLDIYHVGLLFLQLALSKEMKFTSQEILDGKPRELALKLPSPFNFAIEKSLRRHVEYRTASAMELWRDLHTPI